MDINKTFVLLKDRPDLIAFLAVLVLMLGVMCYLVNKFIKFVLTFEQNARLERELMAKDRKIEGDTFRTTINEVCAVVDRNTEATLTVVKHCSEVSGRDELRRIGKAYTGSTSWGASITGWITP